MNPNRLVYADWLDVETVEAELSLGKDPAALKCERLRRLKLHALLGNRICLSHQQLVGPQVCEDLFADPDFRRAVYASPELGAFLELRAPVPKGDGEPGQRRLWRVHAGLNAVVNAEKSWGERVDSQEVFRPFCKAIIERNRVDWTDWLANPNDNRLDESQLRRNGYDLPRERWARSERFLAGVVHALHFFCECERSASRDRQPLVPEYGYYEAALETRKNLELNKSAIAVAGCVTLDRLIERVQELKNQTGDPTILFKRNRIQQHLKRVDSESDRLWRTILHGWNAAQVRGLQVHASMSRLGNSVPVGMFADGARPVYAADAYHDKMSDIAVPVARFLGVDPLDMSWTAIATVVERTAEVRAEFQDVVTILPESSRVKRNHAIALLKACAQELARLKVRQLPTGAGGDTAILLPGSISNPVGQVAAGTNLGITVLNAVAPAATAWMMYHVLHEGAVEHGL